MLTIKESPGTPLFINKFVFLLSAGISLKVGTSRWLIMNRPSVHKKGILLPWSGNRFFKVNNTDWRSHFHFHDSAALFVSDRIFPSL